MTLALATPWLMPRTAAAEGDPSRDSGELHLPSPSDVVTARPAGGPQAGASFDTVEGHAFDGELRDTSGSSMSSSSLYARLALRVPVGERLVLSFPLDAAVSFYAFNGNPLLLPGGGAPWDQVRSFSVGVQGRYRVNERWALIGAADVASAGARGASFGDTLSQGGTLGFSYALARGLTLGAGVTVQSQLVGGLYVIPFPVIDWVLPFDGGRWRLAAGAVQASAARTASASLLYTPSPSLTFNVSIAAPGLGREFRLSSSGPIASGVGRDSASPLTMGLELRPMKALTCSLYGGVNILHTVTVLDGAGNTLEQRDVKPSPVLGGRISLAF